LALGYEDLGVGSRLVKRLFFSLPRPDLPIILDAPPELTYERKKADDAGFEYYAVQRQRYLELARSMDIPIVSTNQPFEETLSSVWRRVKKALLTTLEQAVT
jgi:thymidylate kinase